jgi:molecular chaperone DnaK
MPQKHAIGIDLGTSTSEICVFRPEGSGADRCHAIPDPSSPGGSPIVPSLVALNNNGELVVGEEARPWVDLPGRGVREVKRLMGSGQTVRLGEKDYRPEEIAAVILRKLRQQAEAALGETVRDVVLSVPANFPDAARRATFDAGQLAGLNITRLINEPTAAALAFGVENVDADEQVVVFDFGGGTLDITVLEMVFGVLDVKASFGDTQLGGKDFDEILRHLIAQKFRIAHPGVTIDPTAAGLLKSAAETVKLALTTKDSHRVHLRGFVFHEGQPIDLEVEITRAEFEAACQPLLDRARACIQQALDAKKVRPEAIDRIVLVGGTTYMPCVRRLVGEMFGQMPQADVSPDLAVCIGAAVQAAIALGQLDPERGLILTDVAPFGMGIQVVSEVGGILTPVYEPLIMPNTTVPYSTRREYSLLTTQQEAVIVHLYQDHKGAALKTDDAEDNGIRARIASIPPSQSGRPHTIVIHFSYDVDGLAKLAAVIPHTGQTVRLEYTPSQKRLDDDGKRLSQQRVEDLWQRSPAAKRFQGVVVRAEALLTTLTGERQARLEQSLAELKAALASGDSLAIDAAGLRLTCLVVELEKNG